MPPKYSHEPVPIQIEEEYQQADVVGCEIPIIEHLTPEEIDEKAMYANQEQAKAQQEVANSVQYDIFFLEEVKHRLAEATKELHSLRAQLRIVDVFASALGMKHGSNGVEVNFDWRFERYIDNIKSQNERNKKK